MVHSGPEALRHHKLVGFQRKVIPAQGKMEVYISIPLKELYCVQKDGSTLLAEGEYTLYAGGCQPDERSIELTGQKLLAIRLKVLADCK